MLRETSGLTRSVGRWVAQVAASAGATLVATLIYAAIPHAPPRQLPASPELTSGGKFAARVTPASYDGLDAMPLPRVLPLVATAPAPVAEATPPAAFPRKPVPDATPQRPARALRTSARSAPQRPPASEAAPAAASATAVEAAPVAEDGVWPAIRSSAGEVWRLTSSTGIAMMARVVPQLP